MGTTHMVSLAYELAADEVTDDALATELGLDRGEITRLSQGRRRHSAPDGIGPSHLAASVAKSALSAVEIEPATVDFIIFSTNTPDFTFPGSACLLQHDLGCGHVGCLDVRAVCSGFIVALDLARRYVGSGQYARVLVATAEVPSHQNRYDGTAPELACRTGDASAVAVVEGGGGSLEVLAATARMDGRLHRQLWCEFPASRNRVSTGTARGERLTRAAIEEGRIYPIADFEALRTTALERIPEALDTALAEAGLDSVDAAIVAHVDPATEAAVGERILARAGRLLERDLAYAYSATLPIALERARERGELAAGETVALLTSGGGASWAASIVRN